jgi:SEL1 protein
MTNAEAALPVALSLVKLRARSFYNKITRGKINSIGQDDLAVKLEPKPKWTFTQAFKDILQKWTEEDSQTPLQPEEYADEYVPGDSDYDDYDEDYVESLVILGLCGAVALLLWWRNMRNVRFREDQRVAAAAANAGGADVAPPEENRGLFPDPNDPNNPEFARWIGGAPI